MGIEDRYLPLKRLPSWHCFLTRREEHRFLICFYLLQKRLSSWHYFLTRQEDDLRMIHHDARFCSVRAHKQLHKSVNESSFLYTVCERTMHGWPQPSSAHVPAVPHVTESWPAAMYIERGRGGRERERRSAGNDNDKKGMTITHTWSANARFSVFTVLSRSCKIPASLAWSWYAFCKPLLPYKRLKSVSLVVSLAYLWV